MTDISPLSDFLTLLGSAGYDWDLRKDEIRWFGDWKPLFGAEGQAPINSKTFFDAVMTEDRPTVFGQESGETFDRNYRLRLSGGAVRWVHEYGTLEMEGGQPVRQRGLLRAIEKPLTLISSDFSGRDSLTGCFDRNHMLTLLTRGMDAARTARKNAAYLVVGIDKMSFVNEAVGMVAGDALLRGVAERLTQIMPARAALARVGGDMFGILLPEPLGNDMPQLAERILQSVRDYPIMTSVTPLHITVSIGGCRLPAIAKSGTEAMIFAEQALHSAHQRGRNLFDEYLDSPERMQENRQLLELGESIKQAFKQNGFRLAYQPIIDAASGQTLFYEALVRMFEPDGKPIAAAKFVPAIEQLGLAFQLDRLVLDMAVREMKAAPDLSLAINISGLTAAQADWPEHMERVLKDCPDVARRLVIEITETAAIVDVTETRRFVDSLRALGGRVALDDFGAGFTSIGHLRSLALSIMKIDKDLLHNLLTASEQQHLVRSLIELARGLGLQTIVEGVENEEIAAWFRSEKIDMMQGYYFGKPSLERTWNSTLTDAAPAYTPAAPAAVPVVKRVAS